MSELSVRERVHRIQVELRDGEVPPSRAREMLVELTSLLGNCIVEVSDAEIAYTQVLARELDTEAKANRARIRAELAPEYRRLKEAKATQALVVELIRTLRAVLRSTEEEMRLAGR